MRIITITGMTILFFMGCGESAGRYSVGPSELNVTDEFDSGVEEDFLGFDLSRQGDGTMDHNVAPDVTVLPPLSDFATCDPELAWMTPGTNFDIIYGTPRLSVAPDGALVARYMGGPITYYRMSDGTYLGNEGGGWDTTLTTTWKHRVELVLLSDNWFGVELRDILTGELINTIDAQPSPDPELDWLRAMEVFVSADDNLLATMTCWSRVGGDLGVARVTLHNLETGSNGPVVDLDVPCGEGYWPDKEPGILSPDGRYLAISLHGIPEVYLVELEQGVVSSFDPIGEFENATPVNENWGYGTAPVLGMAFSPDAKVLALTDQAGNLTRWTVPQLQAAGEPIPVALVGINQYTYGPSLESPVAWSDDGLLIAHLDDSGEAVIRQAADNQILLTIPRPFDLQPEWTGNDVFNPATGFQFTSDGKGLLVAFELGLAYWSCPDALPPEPSGTLSKLILVGPSKAASQSALTWNASVQSDGQPVVFRFLLDDVLLTANLSGVASTTIYEPGTHQMKVIADDGFIQVSFELAVVIE